MKTCTKCGETKPFEGFSPVVGGVGGVVGVCKVCRCAKAREQREADPAKAKARWAAWAETRREERRAYNAEWRGANKDLVSAYKKNADASTKAWRKANPEKTAAYNKKIIVSLTKGYVASLLGLRAADLTHELLALKREQIFYHRLLREAKQLTKEKQ